MPAVSPEACGGGNDAGDLERASSDAVYAASRENQECAGVSSFVDTLIDGLGSKAADLNDDLHLTIDEWYTYGDNGNQGELVGTYDASGTKIGDTPVDPQYFDHGGDMLLKYVAYDNIPIPPTLALIMTGFGIGIVVRAGSCRKLKQ